MSRFTRSKFPFKSKASASSAVCSLAFVSILLVNSQLKCTVKIFVQTGFAFLKICKNYFQIFYKTIIEVDIFCMQTGVCRTYLSDPLYSGTIFLKFYSRPGELGLFLKLICILHKSHYLKLSCNNTSLRKTYTI